MWDDFVKQIILHAFPNERLVPQTIEEWRGEFPLPNDDLTDAKCYLKSRYVNEAKVKLADALGFV